MIIVIGHKNPDTDSVVSAIMLTRILHKEGKKVRPAIAGKINRETDFILSYFKQNAPQIISENDIAQHEIFLVDHNELNQSIASKDNIYGVLDHHPLSGIKTDNTIYFRVEPLGSTATLIYKIIKEKGINIKEEEAGLLLSAIISDTLNLNSSTTTTEDIDYLYELSQIAKIDSEDLAQKMFEAKSDFSGRDINDIIRGDMKEYDFNGKKVGIGVSETTSLSYFDKNEAKVVQAVEKAKKDTGLDAFYFAAVNIINQITYFYPAGEEEKKVIREVFTGKEKDNLFLLTDISSRKKEIAPPLSAYYEKI